MTVGTSDPLEIHCPCGAQARVPAAYEGKKVRCKQCGEGVRVRALALASESQLRLSPSAVEPKARTCPSCCARLAKGARVCMRCGHDRRARRGGRRAIARTQVRGETKDFIIPLALLGVGSAIYLGAGVAAEGSLGLAATAGALAVGMAAWLVVALLGCFLAGSFMFKTNFGRFDVALIKLAAVGIFPDAIALLAVLCIGPFVGAYAGWVVMLVGTWIMLSWLFDMSLGEAIFYSFLCRLLAWFVVIPGLAALLGAAL